MTADDYKRLIGGYNSSWANRVLRMISAKVGTARLSISAYCRHVLDDPKAVWEYLRGQQTHLAPGYYMTTKDLLALTGNNNKGHAAQQLLAIRDAIGGPRKQRLSIKEYCSFEGLDFDEVWQFLRGPAPEL